MPHGPHTEVIRVALRLPGLVAASLPIGPSLWPLVHPLKRTQEGGEELTGYYSVKLLGPTITSMLLHKENQMEL